MITKRPKIHGLNGIPKMLASDAPRHPWDDCLELEVCIHSHSVNNLYSLDHKVPETYMSWEKADISQFGKLACYNWIMFRPGTIDYPDELLCLGKYLGPTINVGLSMTAKILQHNGKVMYRSTYHPLTVEEWTNLTVQKEMATFKDVHASVMLPHGNKMMHGMV